ncbi:indole-3-glycerol phosphate synthase [Pontibacillus halophilus JSM 076056 = DSM 19796]|uniref:Indole-3-glycerol phosphate synthase n=1 Tax=Pontibacillus halophilus JSM 076056 = DSM 19796 TaxID=1385510 RepID=A0A0A5GPW9_9BACI|nr:indole-3-glycerol phosphate synthase TrpC [Pontibacillus halophilus]KGX93989.1 indole-3-glycerol phosphate synthase [Pontibacillus halophilus JSM 076056 = DSM 19796]
MLHQILETKKDEITRYQQPEQVETDSRSLYDALLNSPLTVGLIAEVKKASPSKGVIREDFRPVEIAKLYEEGGASAISVLTDEMYFQGHRDYLTAVKQATKLPVLRKDFIIDEKQVEESARIGADAILLIGEALQPERLYELYRYAASLGLESLVEVHAKETLEGILAVFQPKIIGINNRDLTNFHTTVAHTETIAKAVPEGSLLVSESGIYNHEDINRVKQAGAKAVLVGEALMREAHPADVINQMMGREQT